MIPVTKPYLPSRENLDKYLDGIYERKWLTNNGVLVQELTARLEEYLGVENLLLVANGTLALQVAYRALGVAGGNRSSEAPQAITSPFSFVATASSLKWEGIKPVYADIDPHTWCLNPRYIEKQINPNTRAIVPVHVFGNACEVESIGQVAKKHHLKVIYDASHAFGVGYRGESLLNHGDAATLSFHATKLFHTGEGGAIIFRYKEDLERAKKIINFGITGPESIEELGINAKMNEVQAAMGLCVLEEMPRNLALRKQVWETYKAALNDDLVLQRLAEGVDYNYSYFPVVFRDENQVLAVSETLKEHGVLIRRYFYPSLDTISFIDGGASCDISQDISGRIACLPIYADLSLNDVERIAALVNAAAS